MRETSTSNKGMRTLRPTIIVSATFFALTVASAQQEGPTNQIHYPLANELGQVLKTADKARKAGKLDRAVELYRNVLDADGPKAYRITESTDARTANAPRRYVGITEKAIASLRALPSEGVKFFRAKYDYRAGSALDEAKASKTPFRELMRAYELYPISRHSRTMLETAADLAFEEGALGRSRRVLRMLLEHHKHELPSPPKIYNKMLLCSIGVGDAEEVRRLGLVLRRDDPDGKLHIGGAPFDLPDLIAEALKVAAVMSGRQAKGKPTVPAVRGDSQNRAWFDVSRVSFGPARFQQRVFADRSPIVHMRAGRILPGTLTQGSFPARNLAVIHDGSVFVLTADALMAFDIGTGARPRRILPLPGRPKFRDTNPKVQFGAAIDRGTLVAPLVEDVKQDQSYRGIPIKVKIPIRKLAGFDLARWRWTWDHARLLKNTPLEAWSFPCPPASEEGLVFASAWSIEGFVDCNVAAFASSTGKPVWRTRIASGQVEQTMFGEQATEPLCVPVAVANGVVYHSTSFGSVTALDADTGRIKWVTEYRQIEVRAPRGYYADPRNIAWENNAPVVEAGVVVVAPLDSPNFYGYRAADGKRLWKASRRRYAADADMRYLMGASDGHVLLGGGHEVRCLEVRSGKLTWRAPLRGRLVAGRGCIAGRTVCVPVDRNEVFLFDLKSGKRTGRFALSSTGNLLLAGDSLVISGNGTLAVHRSGGTAQGRDFK
jgi:outer membrane protein assembly factor BamB